MAVANFVSTLEEESWGEEERVLVRERGRERVGERERERERF